MQELLNKMDQLQREYSLERSHLRNQLTHLIQSREVVTEVPNLQDMILGSTVPAAAAPAAVSVGGIPVSVNGMIPAQLAMRMPQQQQQQQHIPQHSQPQPLVYPQQVQFAPVSGALPAGSVPLPAGVYMSSNLSAIGQQQSQQQQQPQQLPQQPHLSQQLPFVQQQRAQMVQHPQQQQQQQFLATSSEQLSQQQQQQLLAQQQQLAMQYAAMNSSPASEIMGIVQQNVQNVQNMHQQPQATDSNQK